MYNSKIKKRFIEEKKLSKGITEKCRIMFDEFEPYEKEWGKDLCAVEAEKIKPVFSNLAGTRSAVIKAKYKYLKMYAEWCIDNNIKGACRDILDMDVLTVNKMEKITVTSPTHLQKFFNSIFDPEIKKRIDNVYRCVLWLAYMGVPKEEVLNIKTSEVDLKQMVLIHNDIEYPIYRESVPAFINCIHLNSFYYIHPKYSTTRQFTKPRAEGDTLIRGYANYASFQILTVQISKLLARAINEEKTDLKLSYYRVWISGLFYRMYQDEMMGIPPDFTNAAMEFMEGKDYKLDKTTMSLDSKCKRVAKNYLEDYKIWKSVFVK